MKRFKGIASSLATIILVILALQVTWNVVAPLFGGPQMNIVQMASTFVFVILSVGCISIMWNIQPNVQQVFHYDVPKNDTPPEGQ